MNNFSELLVIDEVCKFTIPRLGLIVCLLNLCARMGLYKIESQMMKMTRCHLLGMLIETCHYGFFITDIRALIRLTNYGAR